MKEEIYLPLDKHIEKYHKGKRSSFARSIGRFPQDVSKWLRLGRTIVFKTGHVHHTKVAPFDPTPTTKFLADSEQELVLQKEESKSEHL